MTDSIVFSSQTKQLRISVRFGLIWRSCANGDWFFLPGWRKLWQIAAPAVKRSRMRVLFSGKVQGVGFRYTARTVASGFEVTGTVRNLPDGKVEMVAEGERDELEAFRGAVRDAGLDHFIKSEDVSWSDATNEFRGFEIVR
jgi:acylphosphatase